MTEMDKLVNQVSSKDEALELVLKLFIKFGLTPQEVFELAIKELLEQGY